MHRRTIVSDFDGVIHRYEHPFMEPDFIPDPPVVGAIDFLRRVMENPEYELKIFSTRNNDERGIRAMQNYLKFWFMKEFGWNEGCGWGNEFYKHNSLLPKDHPNYWVYFPKIKPIGWINIDDRVLCFQGLFPSFDEIDKFRAWNDQEKVQYKP